MPKGITYLLRSLWYALRTALIIGAVALAAYWAFNYAYNAANIYIILQDGLRVRAEVVMQDEDLAELSKYFTDSFVASDALLSSGTYRGYVIRSFSHVVKFESIATELFSSKGTAVITERVSSIDGEIPESETGEPEDEAAENAEAAAVPAWENARYKVTLRKANGIWKIERMELVELLPTPSPSPTPLLSPTPTPTPTPQIIIESSPSPD